MRQENNDLVRTDFVGYIGTVNTALATAAKERLREVSIVFMVLGSG